MVALWGGATLLLGAAVVVWSTGLHRRDTRQLALPLAFASGAVLASVVDTLAPEAFRTGGSLVALASAAGFFTAFVLSV